MASNKKIINSLWKLYNDDLKEEIKLHWKNKADPKCEEDFYKWQSKQIPWFGNLKSWMDEIFNLDEVPAVFEKFPLSIQRHTKEVAAEMNFLFPQGELTSAFLPIILTGYCTKRRQPPKNSRKSEGGDSSKEDPSKQLIDILFGRNPEAPKENIPYSLIESYLKLPTLHKKNKRMKSSQVNYKKSLLAQC